MAHARSPRDGPTGARGTTDEDGSVTTKVVLMELVRSGRPLSVAEVAGRTLLSESAVVGALTALRERGLCRERPGDDRRPTRFDAVIPESAER